MRVQLLGLMTAMLGLSQTACSIGSTTSGGFVRTEYGSNAPTAKLAQLPVFVSITASEPDRPYRALGNVWSKWDGQGCISPDWPKSPLFRSETNRQERSDQLVIRLREEAAKIGADAVIRLRIGSENIGAVSIPVKNIDGTPLAVVHRPLNVDQADGVAVVWTESGGEVSHPK